MAKGKKIPDSIVYSLTGDQEARENERIVHLEKYGQYYLIGLDVSPCWVKSVYDGASGRTIFERSSQESTNKLLQQRFEEEVLKKAEQYGKTNNLADSIMHQ